MSPVCPHCPLLESPTVRFIGFHLFGDFYCIPETENVFKSLILHYHFENPDASIAREKVTQNMRDLKAVIEEGSDDPDYIYQYEGLRLHAQYEIVYPDTCGGDVRVRRKVKILDGNAVSEDELNYRFQMEADLMNSMDISI